MAEHPFTVATCNLRVDAGAASAATAWPARRPLMRASLRRIAPDILGTQEGLPHQLQDLADDLPEYQWVGQGREGGGQGEVMAIFYRHERYEARETQHYWLSDTPDIPGSCTWGNQFKRMATAVRLFDRLAQRELIVLNTHWDHAVQEAREKSARLMRERTALWPSALPLVLTGDFNAEAGNNPAYDLLVQDGFFRDAWATAARRCGDEALNTFHDFQQPPRREGRRIDWIMLRGPVRADTIEVVNDARDGRRPSDHFPVVARLAFD
ncbi:MAG: endonuclease/exonuclease/phosphatase family protein [Candidatus Didemnitutus sp.]|nr:endonuclease/exonuclease/phosphatase family protein [Candidatus Didemnitutus sp.]